MRSKIGVYVITLCLVVVLSIGYLMPIIDYTTSRNPSTEDNATLQRPSKIVTYAPHSPIIIDGDTNFSATALAEGWTGDGSIEDPYIIHGYEIDQGGAGAHCISIINTLVYFTINNCHLIGANVSSNAGVYLENVTYGEIVGNIFDNNYYGLYLADSHSILIKNNTCNNNINGIAIYQSNFNTLRNNTCISNSDNGIQITNADNNIVTENLCNFNGLRGILLIDHADYNTASSNTCNNNDNDGIYIYDYCYHNTIVNNTCNSNNDCGIHLYYYCHINTITNNTCSRNDYGILLISIIEYTEIIENIFTTNNHGIYFDDVGSVEVHWNVFESNITNGYCINNFDNPNDFEYNYWSDFFGDDDDEDGFGDFGYSFTGGVDPNPLVYLPTPPKWVETPTDCELEMKQSFIYNINATAPAPIYWSLDDTYNFSIDDEGVIESIACLYPGNYDVTVTATTIYGYSISASFTVFVFIPDNDAPEWIIAPMDVSFVYDEGVDFQIAAVDSSGIDLWALNDTTHFTLIAAFYDLGSIARITNNSMLEPAVYSLNITVYDTFENRLSSIFTVTVEPHVQDTTSPIWIVSPFDEVLEYGISFEQRLGAWDSSGISYWWLNDTTYFSIDENGIMQNATILEPGTYSLEVRLYDPFDNFCSASLVVTVREAPVVATTTTNTVTSTTTDTDATTDHATNGTNPMTTFVLGAGIGGAVVVAITVIVLVRKKT